MQRSTSGITLLPREIQPGLLLRRATEADAEALARFNVEIHGEPVLGPWVRHLMAGNSPDCRANDFTVVEDTREKRIVSSLMLFSQRWAYSGVLTETGQVGLVGTEPAYRRRGLVRAQMEVVHAWSAERGHLMQVIEGLPYFYRQFGYQMCCDLLAGREGDARQWCSQAPEGGEPYTLRPADEADIPLLVQLSAQADARTRLSIPRDAALWRYELSGRCADDPFYRDVRVIEDRQGQPVGLLVHSPKPDWGALSAAVFELLPGKPWWAVTPVVMRYLRACEERAGGDPDRARMLRLCLGDQHPAYAALPAPLSHPHRPYAYYLRVPDVPAFLMHVRPVLERRLADSPMAGWTGTLALSLYRGGVELRFERGALESCREVPPGDNIEPSAAFPDLTFLHLLFGYRTLEEVRHLWPDCSCTDKARPVIEALFPQQMTSVWTA
ncbi:MAG TPA: GNAT family N-acetyltransferase [Armatimonadota bacterium]|jgi:hypothetical protein